MATFSEKFRCAGMTHRAFRSGKIELERNVLLIVTAFVNLEQFLCRNFVRSVPA